MKSITMCCSCNTASRSCAFAYCSSFIHVCIVVHLQTTEFELRRLVNDEVGKVSAAANGVDSGGGNWEEHGTIISYLKSGIGGQEVEKQTVFGPSNAVIRGRVQVNDVSCLHPSHSLLGNTKYLVYALYSTYTVHYSAV